jgi:hypothetical protein
MRDFLPIGSRMRPALVEFVTFISVKAMVPVGMLKPVIRIPSGLFRPG